MLSFMKIRMHSLVNGSLTVLICCCLTGCSSVSGMRLSPNPDKVAAQIRKRIPIGTDVQTAKELMAEMKFDCEWATNKNFVVWRGYYDNKMVHGPMDYL